MEMRQWIRDCLNEKTKIGRIVGFIIQGLIIVSLISLAVQTIPDIPEHVNHILETISMLCMLVFVTEYSLRVYTEKHVFRYMFSFFGIIDLIAIAPYFFIGSGIDSSSLRALRLLRIFQLFKLARYSKASHRFKSAFKICREELIFFGVTASIIFFMAAVGIYHFEHNAQPEAFPSIIHSLWWAMITLTTIGYGDIYPVTHMGKMFTGLIIPLGLGIVSAPTCILASALSEARKEEKTKTINDKED